MWNMRDYFYLLYFLIANEQFRTFFNPLPNYNDHAQPQHW